MVFTLPRLTLFGRSVLLLSCEVAANAICWTVAGILFGKNSDTRPVLSLALLAWTLGLRHALDADHISAIDNATRGLINLGQLPVTCGLFFSLGHSTIVIVVIVAIAISADVYNKIGNVGTVGGIVGAAVSGSFLFLIGLANTIILLRIIRRRRQNKLRDQRIANGETVPEEVTHDPKESHMLMMRILGPIITFVNRPWKMYPVGVLFGFGFDTASSIALLAISAIAKKGPNGSSIPNAQIVILPLLFTSGMTLVDSADSILMLYSYSGFPERTFFLFKKPGFTDMERGAHLPSLLSDIDDRAAADQDPQCPHSDVRLETQKHEIDSKVGSISVEHRKDLDSKNLHDIDHKIQESTDLKARPDTPLSPNTTTIVDADRDRDSVVARDTRVKMNVMSGLSIILTLMSILVAFSISLITIMGLIGEQCTSCVAAAEADGGHGGGIAGRWWRGWANANAQSGYIGAAIVGGFLLIVVGWYGGQWAARKIKEKRGKEPTKRTHEVSKSRPSVEC
ncbi:high-affinity nickel-transport protein-domain-containing protein [Crassisporium funariophilum]|nr:high-affinity nickel-transport protein-domain-containing protein [Crassisporium funariophilum]